MRRTALAVASLLVAATLAPAAAGQAVTPVERAARISLSAPSTVAPYSKVTLKGRTGARRGAKITIFQRPTTRASWNVEGTTRVKKRGKFSYSEGVTDFSRYYRACLKRSCSPARFVTVAKPTPQPPPPPATPQPTSLALTAGPAAQIEAGQSVTVSGTASANLAGTAVYLQAYDGTSKTWGAVGGSVVSSAATWTVSGPIGTSGKAIALRVISADTPSLIGSSVDAGAVAVFGWYPLDDTSMPADISGSYVGYGPRTINAIPYSSSVYFDYSSYSSSYDSLSEEWNLSRSCKTFSATVGLPDTSSVTSRYSFQLFADSVQKDAKSGIALGTSTPVSIDISNALRLKIAVQRTAGSGASLSFGDAKALCAF